MRIGARDLLAVTYYVAVPFNKDEEGNLLPSEAKECPNVERARRMAALHAGAIAFSRSGDLDHDDFQDATVIAVYGAVDVNPLGGKSRRFTLVQKS